MLNYTTHSQKSLFVQFVFALLLIFNTTLPAQELEWALGFGSINDDHAADIAIDESGYTYITGPFRNTILLGEGEPNETEFTSVSSADIFIAKYNQDGLLEWARRAGGSNFDGSRAITIDNFGNLYIIGNFLQTVTFGAGQSNETTFTAAGSFDSFIAKYNTAGEFQWAKQIGGIGIDNGNGISTDDLGLVYVTGDFQDSAQFAIGEPAETTLVAHDFIDLYLAKFDQDGNLVWVVQAGGESTDSGNDLVIDDSGNSYIAGHFYQTLIFNEGLASEVTLESGGQDDMFTAKFDNNGQFLWAKSAGSFEEDNAESIAKDALGNIYITGYFSEAMTFEEGEVNEITLFSIDATDIFIAKYSPNGVLQWVRQAGGTSTQEARAITLDLAGNIYITGHYQDTMIFGEGGPTGFTAQGGRDIFLAMYGSNGSFQLAKSAGGLYDIEEGLGVAVNGSGQIYLTGRFGEIATFGENQDNEANLTSNGDTDVFIAKFNPELFAEMTVTEGWNLISLPFTPFSGDAETLFPNHTPGSVFAFNGSYTSPASLQTLEGYWMHFSADETVPIYGTPEQGGSIFVEPGWQIIGGPDCDLPVSELGIPIGAIGSDFFGYDGGYYVADTLKPGNGYWVKANFNSFILALCPVVLKSNSKRVAKSTDLSLQSRLDIQDTAGNSVELYFKLDDDIVQSPETNFMLPPVPPLPSFDARFEGDVYGIAAEEAIIQVQSASYPLTVSTANLSPEPGKEYVLEEMAGNLVLKTHVLREGETVQITNLAIRTLKLSVSGVITSIEDAEGALPAEFRMHQNYPNPFNPATTIKYELPARSDVKISIYNSIGQEVKTLVSQQQEAGFHELVWDATNAFGAKVVSGVYFYQINAGSFNAVRKMILMK